MHKVLDMVEAVSLLEHLVKAKQLAAKLDFFETADDLGIQIDYVIATVLGIRREERSILLKAQEEKEEE